VFVKNCFISANIKGSMKCAVVIHFYEYPGGENCGNNTIGKNAGLH